MRSHFILTFITSAALTSPVFAAEPGTYRPGTPYYSSQAGSSEICESQCTGDAQCRGWNFVKVSPQADAGVCEFNSTSAAPVPSPVSISGNNDGRSYSRSVSAGGTNTVRVGSPAPASKPARTIPARTASRPVTSNAAAPSPQNVRPGARAIRPGQQQAAPTRRRVVRQPIPQTRQPAAAAYRQTPQRPTQHAIPQRTRPQFQHSLDDALPLQARPQQAAPQRQMMRPQQRSIARPAATNAAMGDPRLQHMLRQQAARPSPPPAAASIPPQMPKQRASVLTPPAMPTPTPPQRPQSLADAEASLFGSLHDDVIVPKPITPAAAANPDAPIATAQAVPVKKITVESLMGLAGGPGN